MDGDDEERAFMNSRLIATSDGKDVSLSHSTIASLARSMIELLKYAVYNTVPVSFIHVKPGFQTLALLRELIKQKQIHVSWHRPGTFPS